VKCLDEYYIDFLAYLAGFEASGLKIYDLLKAIYNKDVEINQCYLDLAKIYMTLESIVGDPSKALVSLSDLYERAKISQLLRDYSKALLTTGDTYTLVSNALKQEFTSLKAKISEFMRIVELAYEALMAALLGLLAFIVLPTFSVPSHVGILFISLTWIFTYYLSATIASKIYFGVPLELVLLDIGVISAGVLTTLTQPYGVVVHVIICILLHVIASFKLSKVLKAEQEVVRILDEIYSRSTMGEPVDVALAESIKSSPIEEYQLIWLGLINGVSPITTSSRLSLPQLSKRVISLLSQLIPYVHLNSGYVASVVTYVDEIRNLRRFVMEKSRFYTVYSVIVALLVIATYYMVSTLPLLRIDRYTIGVYVYLATLVSSTPPCILHDRSLSASRRFVLLTTIGLIAYYILVL
jgi:hypothetical protein